MALEQRIFLDVKAEESDVDPGLALRADGTIDHIADDGTRKKVVGAGGDVAGPAYTQTYATALRTVPAETQVAAPAGGTGATAGAYDSAANRDLAIASINAAKVDIEALKKVVNGLIDDLQAAGILS